MATDDASPSDLGRQVGELLREQRALIARLQQGQAHFQELARSVWRVQEEERRRLANDLHDGVGHNLTAVLHLLAEACAALPGRPLDARAGLERARAIAAATLQDTRAMSRLLRPQILDDLGLEAALRWLVRTAAETHGFGVSLDYDVAGVEPDADRRTLVFRLAQEALANVARHAGATHVDVGFRCSRGSATLAVRDDGHGCDLAAASALGSGGSSSGLGGMRERVRLYGGVLQLESTPGTGFHLRAVFPLADAPGDRA
jgi:signal transduction histidine kinase